MDNGHIHREYEQWLDRITSLMERLVTTVQTLAEVSDERMNALDERMKALADSQQHSDYRFNVMIDYFQRHLEEHGKQQ